ncbi:MAG: hypothetical protein HWE18_06295 [Gammaproteobacteria bacterium]|nr:hypothetical protein [Gammaproteobacteria bacterium]
MPRLSRMFTLIAFLLLPSLTQANVISETVDDISESYEKCEELYEHIRKSECANSVFGLLGRMYFQVGVSFTERQVKFQNSETEEDVFILSSGLKPRPIFSVSLSDSYFGESNFGYGLGFSYFDDYAFEQIIKRGGGDNDKATVDLGTYSSMNVVAVSPTLFYSIGRNDNTPLRFLKLGLGLNFMYSAVRGTAYLTELETDTDCYNYGSAYVDGTVNDENEFKTLCDSTRFRETSFGSGFKVFLSGEWNRWEGTFASSLFLHRGQGDYRFVTQEVQIALSRKFEF